MKNKKPKPKEIREEKERVFFSNRYLADVYKGTFNLLGEMSQLPDSQKIFGAMVYFMSDLKGKESASEYIKKIKDEPNILGLSSMMPENMLPVPKSLILKKINTSVHEQKIPYTNLKKLDFTTIDVITRLLKNPDELKFENFKVENSIVLTTDQQVHVNTLSDESDNNKIFSVMQTRCMRNTESVKSFTFFMKTSDPTMPELLERNIGHVFTLGKRSSQGYNLFELVDFIKYEKIQKLKQPTYLNLGMLIPNNIDFTNDMSALTLFTSQRRPYTASDGHWLGFDNNGNVLSFIAPGSVVVAKEANQSIGKNIPDPHRKNGEIIFGNAFMYPLEVNL